MGIWSTCKKYASVLCRNRCKVNTFSLFIVSSTSSLKTTFTCAWSSRGRTATSSASLSSVHTCRPALMRSVQRRLALQLFSSDTFVLQMSFWSCFSIHLCSIFILHRYHLRISKYLALEGVVSAIRL